MCGLSRHVTGARHPQSPVCICRLPSLAVPAPTAGRTCAPTTPTTTSVTTKQHKTGLRTVPQGTKWVSAGAGKVRPKSATAAHTTRPLAGMGASDYKLRGMGLENRGGVLGPPASAAGAGYSSSSFGPATKQRPSSSYGAVPPPAVARPPAYAYPGPASQGGEGDIGALEESRQELARLRAL